MKKIVSFFGIFALIAGFVTSCGDDDDDEVFVQKKLVKLTNGDEISEFKYDSEGRCIAYSFRNENINFKNSYKYEGNTITIESDNNGSPETYSATLNSKGYLETRDFFVGNSKDCFKYEYDNQGYLIAEYLFYENGRVDTTMKCEWENGNLVRVKKNNGNSIITYKYTNKNHTKPIENRSGLQFFSPYDFDSALDGLLGKPCKNIPVSYVFDYICSEGETDIVLINTKGSETASQWMFDKDSYPTNVKYDNGNGERTANFVWE